MKKKTEKADTWYEKDAQSWEGAAAELRRDGWTQKPHSTRGATFHKDNKTVALVRTLGVLNWHPAEIPNDKT